MFGRFSRQDIADHILRGPELIFDGDEIIGLLCYSQTSRDSKSDYPIVELGGTDGGGRFHDACVVENDRFGDLGWHLTSA